MPPCEAQVHLCGGIVPHFEAQIAPCEAKVPSCEAHVPPYEAQVPPSIFVPFDIKFKFMTLSQLNDTNAVQKWSFSKYGFLTFLVSKIKGKNVYRYFFFVTFLD